MGFGVLYKPSLLIFWGYSVVILCHEGDSLPISRRVSDLSRFTSKIVERVQGERIARTALYSASENNSANFITRQKFLAGFGGALALVPLVELYSRAGSKDFPKEFLSSRNNGDWEAVEHATVVWHGSGGQDQYTDALMKKIQESIESSSTSYSSIIEWSQFSTNIFQASFNAQRIGKQVAGQLLEKAPKLKSIHFIGISVGSFAADAATTAIKQATSNRNSLKPYVQLTLLDPFTQRGIFDFGYGNRSFGKSADYTEQYLNTDDPVPSTNSPLKNCVCYDITNLRPESVFGHDWPVAYYARSGNPGLRNLNNRLERGSVITLEN